MANANEATSINATKRNQLGKGGARSVRREGRVPGVLYGHGEESISLSVDARELQRLVHAVSIENTIVDLELEDARQPYKVLIREIQRHPTRDEYMHVDFFHVAMDEKISVEVPIVVVGDPIGVRQKGGILDHQLRELEVYCLPGQIPEKIEVHVSDLDIGDGLHVRDLPVPEGVEVEDDPDRSVVAVLAPAVAPVEEEAAPVEEEPTEPELIGKRKAEEEGEEEDEEERPSRA
jgi:large subunit ribosomal protein L25